MSRRKQLIALAQSGKAQLFITLTVNPAWGESPEHRARTLVKGWRLIVKAAKARHGYKTIPYFVVFEACKSGEPHLHILARVPWISHKLMKGIMATLMGAPVVEVKPVRSQYQVGVYVAKYCGKAPHRFATCKRYWTTRDWQLTTFEPQKPPGRWHSRWQIVRTPLARLADDWRSQGLEVEERRHRLLAAWRGPPETAPLIPGNFYRRIRLKQSW